MVEITLRGRSGHGSVPRAADNALVRAADVVRRVKKYEAPTVITPGTERSVACFLVPRA